MLIRMPVVEYYTRSTFKGMLWFFGIFLAIALATTIGIATVNVDGTFFNGQEFSFALVFAICMMGDFTSELHFMFQHGVSRRAAFTAFVVHILVLSGFYAVVLFGVNHLLSFVNELLGASMNIQIVFNSVFSGYLDGLGTVPTAIISILFYWVMLLAAGTIGYLFTILFYRLNKLARTILIGAPIAFVVFLPLINVIVDGRIFAFFARLFQWFFGDYANPNPLNGIAFMTVFALLGLTGCFLLIRRIKLKKA